MSKALDIQEYYDMLNQVYASIKQVEELKEEFDNILHPGVVLQHKGSKVTWTIQSVKLVNNKKHCLIKSSKGYQKYITKGNHDTFTVLVIPEAVKILFNKKDPNEL